MESRDSLLSAARGAGDEDEFTPDFAGQPLPLFDTGVFISLFLAPMEP